MGSPSREPTHFASAPPFARFGRGKGRRRVTVRVTSPVSGPAVIGPPMSPGRYGRAGRTAYSWGTRSLCERSPLTRAGSVALHGFGSHVPLAPFAVPMARVSLVLFCHYAPPHGAPALEFKNLLDTAPCLRSLHTRWQLGEYRLALDQLRQKGPPRQLCPPRFLLASRPVSSKSEHLAPIAPKGNGTFPAFGESWCR